MIIMMIFYRLFPWLCKHKDGYAITVYRTAICPLCDRKIGDLDADGRLIDGEIGD